MCAVAVSGLMLAGCQTWSSAKVNLKTSGQDGAAEITAEPTKTAAEIYLTETDITDRKYKVLGDLDVTVNKTTIFNADPTREQVAARLKEEAAKLNADAVILVRYGTVGIGLMSWGALDGKGRAVAYVN